MYKGPFKWWVQSVMPLVFDDSLSYYEVLAKLTKYIEGLTGDVQEIEKVLETIEGIGDITEFTKFLETIQTEIGNLNNLQTANKADLVSAINEVALKADIAYYKPPTGIPESDLSQGVQDKLNRTVDATKYIINNRELKTAPSNNSPADLGLGTYSVPTGGIPWDTLSQDVQDRINAGGGGTGGTTDYTDLNNKPQINGHTLNAGNNTSESLGIGTYSKPSSGIPEGDLSAEVQEKLNTSGGIADSETSFVATRDYEAGELIYINGVLYKTKYKILNGTNLIPGNNIEVTDISNEIEKINSDIEALQSGSGPDSWTLATSVSCDDENTPTRFFEYFNAIGGENYLFIVTPTVNDSRPYDIRVLKRDGTVVKTETVITPESYTQHRFTFTPNDTGEYYCNIAPHYNEKLTNIRVEIEYTQSQGISELWNQVNEASQLEPRVEGLEVLVEQQQDELDDKESKEDSINTQKDNRYFTEIQMNPGYYIALSGETASLNTPVISYSNFAYAIAPCKEGDKFLLTIAGSNTPRAYGFVREDGTIISAANANEGLNNAIRTAPQSAAYLVINDNAGNKSYIIEKTINKEQAGVKVIEKFHNAGYDAGVTPPKINYIAPKRIGNADYIFFNKGDIITIKNGTGFQCIARLYSGTLQNCRVMSYTGTGAWTINDINIIAPLDGFAVVMFANGEDRSADVSVSNFDGQIVVISHEYADIFVNKDEYNNKKVNGVAYSWWVTNRTIDAYGNCYFGYVNKDSYCGVGCECPDGTVYYKNLWKSNNCNDHNAPSVNIVKKNGEEYVFVIGATGQAGDNVIHVCMAKIPNTVMCDFINSPYEIEVPDGYRATCTYSQCFVNGANIYNIFNCHQINRTTGTDNVVKICMKSDDYGVTWKLYRVYYKSNLDYLWVADVEGSNTLKRILVSHNPGDGFYPISTGFINLDTNIIYDGNMVSINKPMTEVGEGELLYDDETIIAEYDDFTVVVEEESGYRLRPLDLFETSSEHLIFLYAKGIGYNDGSDFILYRYNDGTVTEIGHLGRPFELSSSYVTGANFLNNTDCIIYSKNDSGVQDGAHSLHRVKLNNNAIVSDEVIKKSPLCIARPMRFGKAGIVYLIGKYKQYTSMADFLQWAFSVGFVDEY